MMMDYVARQHEVLILLLMSSCLVHVTAHSVKQYVRQSMNRQHQHSAAIRLVKPGDVRTCMCQCSIKVADLYGANSGACTIDCADRVAQHVIACIRCWGECCGYSHATQSVLLSDLCKTANGVGRPCYKSLHAHLHLYVERLHTFQRSRQEQASVKGFSPD